MTVGERMKEKRKALGYSAEYVAAKLGVSPATVYRYEKGTIEKIPGNLLEPLARILCTTPAELLGWPREMDELDSVVHDLYPNFVPGKGYISDKLPPNLLPIRTRKVPILGGIAAGEPIYAQEEHEEYADVDEDTPCDYALRVEGDSMEPTICLGDLVFIRRQPDVNDGQIAAVLIEDSATLKRIFHQSGSLTLISDNAAKYPPRHITCEDGEIRIMGRAVSFKRFLK